MSLYAACAYNDTFSRAACLSPSLWVDPGKVRSMIRRANFAPDTVIYMDYGADEIANHETTRDLLMSTCQALYARGVNLTFRIVPDGTHCEDSWSRQLPVFMACLGL